MFDTLNLIFGILVVILYFSINIRFARWARGVFWKSIVLLFGAPILTLILLDEFVFIQ